MLRQIIEGYGTLAPWEYRKAKKNSKSPPNVIRNLDDVVYVTNSGKKYHRDGCKYLKTKYKSYTLEEVESRGYRACSQY